MKITKFAASFGHLRGVVELREHRGHARWADTLFLCPLFIIFHIKNGKNRKVYIARASL